MITKIIKKVVIGTGILICLLIVGGAILQVTCPGGITLSGRCQSTFAHVPPTAPALTVNSNATPSFPMTGPGFAMTSLTNTCVNGVPRISATWTAQTGTVQYLLQRQFPGSTLWETTGASYVLSATDATWQSGYGPGVYAYRVQGNGTTQAMTVNVPQCGSGFAVFSMSSLTSACVNGLPRVSATWSVEPGTTQYLLQRQFPNSSTWDTTGASNILSATDATWQPSYGPGVYSYRVQGKGVTQTKTVNIPSCALPPPPPAPTFSMTSLTNTCVNGLPRISATWSAESGTTQYLLQRQYPNTTTWETTGASNVLSGTDATWQSGYGPGVYAYRVQGKGTTAGMNVNIPQCVITPPKLTWGAYAGPSMSDLTAFESLVGHQTKLVSTFFGWGDNFPLAYGSSVRDQGKTLVLFWEQDSVTLDQIINGQSDAYIQQFANGARTYGGPVLLAPFHEMNGYWTPWSGANPGNSAAKLILAWRHIHDLFAGVPNVRFVFTVNSDSVPDTPANAISAYYPGDAYVDDVAVDGFNFGAPWQTFDSIFRIPLGQLRVYHKPIYILSMASAAGSGKAAWITDALTTQIPKYPEIVGWIWFNENKEQNWLVNSDANALNAFKAAIPN